LVVHAAADGIALGAAATTNQMDVELIVFLAIMLHKVIVYGYNLTPLFVNTNIILVNIVLYLRASSINPYNLLPYLIIISDP